MSTLEIENGNEKSVLGFSGTAWTPGPWTLVEATEHHGPYVTSNYGNTICDCYCMSNPSALSVRNGGTSYPINHMADHAEHNARLIASAPDLYEALTAITARYVSLASSGDCGFWDPEQESAVKAARAALLKAQGKS